MAARRLFCGRGVKFAGHRPKSFQTRTPTMRRTALPLLLVATALLAGCDALGIETATAVAARKEAEGRAIGSACRHAVRSVESCFQSNPRAGKAAVFAGWREMDQYMRDNNVVGMPSEESTEPGKPEASGSKS
jgi:hypothetical protein